MNAEGGGDKGKGVKRERDESDGGGVIEIVSDGEDIDSLQVMHMACHPSQTFDMKRV